MCLYARVRARAVDDSLLSKSIIIKLSGDDEDAAAAASAFLCA